MSPPQRQFKGRRLHAYVQIPGSSPAGILSTVAARAWQLIQDKKDLKRFALLKEYENQWADLNLTPAELEELGNHLRARLLEKGCDHTLRLTQEWMATVGKTKGVIHGLRNLGGYCDCEVLNNVVSG